MAYVPHDGVATFAESGDQPERSARPGSPVAAAVDQLTFVSRTQLRPGAVGARRMSWITLAPAGDVAIVGGAVRHEPVRARTRPYLVLRNLCERMIALVVLLLLAPALFAFWAIIRLTSEGGGLFWSERVGRHGRLFNMPKFRSMYAGTDLVPREAMTCSVSTVTPIGRWMRRWSLDELPQLWCILKGDMSFIGPRPLIATDAAQRQREAMGINSDVRPGLTGLAQIKGRNHVLPRSKARYDVFYCAHASLLLDWMITLRTVKIVLKGTGIL